MIDNRQQISAGTFAESVGIWRDPVLCMPFAKGRVALYAILKALGIGVGDEVLVPGFTCVVVPAAILYTGASPIYYDIDFTMLQGSPHLAASAITERTKAVLVQHNFGAPAPMGDLQQICGDRGIAIVEDCAHAIGAILDGHPVGTLGTAAFSSFQWSKPASTGLGGIARFNSRNVADCAQTLYQTQFREPSPIESVNLSILSNLYRSWYRPSWYWAAQDSYRWAAKRRMVQGSSSSEELESNAMPADYCKRFGSLRSRDLDLALRTLPNLLVHRNSIHRYYSHQLPGTNYSDNSGTGSNTYGTALRYPLLVENKQDVLQHARKMHIEIGDWFNAPIHPQDVNPERFGYQSGCCQNAERAAARIINLPTHLHVTLQIAELIIDFIKQYAILSDPPKTERTRSDRP